MWILIHFISSINPESLLHSDDATPLQYKQGSLRHLRAAFQP
jgi:hypothetical protein